MRKDKELIISEYQKLTNKTSDLEKLTDKEIDSIIKKISKQVWVKVYHIITEWDYNMLRTDNSMVYVIAPEFDPDKWYSYNKEILEEKKNTKDKVQRAIELIKKYWDKRG